MVEALIAEDFSFTSPYDDHIGRAAYFERCWANAGRIAAIRIERLAESDDAVLVLYRCETLDGQAFRNMECLRFADGRLVAAEVFFGELPKGEPRP